MKTAERRHKLKEALTDAAAHSIGARGLNGLKARELAADVRCAAGAIYNVFADLDDVVLAVNARTLAELEARLTAAVDAPSGSGNTSTEQAVAHLIRLAHAYLHFAEAHTKRWRAVFDHRLPDGRELPEDYRDQQQRLFAFIEQPLAGLAARSGAGAIRAAGAVAVLGGARHCRARAGGKAGRHFPARPGRADGGDSDRARAWLFAAPPGRSETLIRRIRRRRNWTVWQNAMLFFGA